MHGGEGISLSLSFCLVGTICVVVGQIVHKNQFIIDFVVARRKSGGKQEWGGGG